MLASLRFVRAGLNVSRTRWLSTYPNHTIVVMPALSPTMTVGTIGSWGKKIGEKVGPGDSIAEVQTDKASMAFESQEDFIIAKYLVEVGAEVPVGAPILVSVEEESSVAAFADFSLAAASPSAAAPAAPAPAAAAPAPSPSASVSAPTAPATATAAAAFTAPISSNERVFASPLAKKLLRDAGADPNLLQVIRGTGPNGRVIAEDVVAALARGATVAQAIPATVAATATATTPVSSANAAKAVSGVSTGITGVYSDFELSDLAQAVARRQTAAKQAIPHYYLSVELNLSKLLQLRESLNPTPNKGAAGLSVMDFVVKAAALAVGQVPDVNASWMDTFVRRYDQVDVNIIMGTGEGLLTPVIKDVAGKGLRAISNEISSFEDSLFTDKEGATIDYSKMSIGTFSIHNLGMYGVKSAAPIVLAPQACALALGAIQDTVVPNLDAKEGQDNWKIAPVMVVTLSCDHRVVDGAVGAQYLAAFKTLIENPTTMLL